MKKLLILFLAVVLMIPAISMGSSAASKPDGLVNSLYKLQTDKNFTVGYFGGSVTWGTGATNADSTSWRGITREWFKSEFPDATVTEVNAGEGGTGSIFGLYRAEDKLIKSKAPDLVFIEFAVNDPWDKVVYKGRTIHNPTTNTEAIIKKIYASNPKADIVFIITGERSTITNSDFGSVYQELAEYYDLPIIYVGKKLADYMTANGGLSSKWNTYFTDIVHPKDAGYRHYADTIIDYLEAQLKSGYTATSGDYANKSQPSMSYSSKNSKGKLFLDADMEINPSDLTNFQNDGFVYESGKMKPNKVGATLSFEFTGSSIGIWTVSSPSASYAKYKINGGAEQSLDVILNNETNHKMYILADGLNTAKTHTLELTFTGGNPIDIRQFLFAGAPSTGNSAGVVGPNDDKDDDDKDDDGGQSVTVDNNKKVVSKPEFKLSGDKVKKLKITSETESSNIFYTLDGSDPITSKTRVKYGGEIVLTKNTVVKAYAMKAGMTDSEVAVYNYKVGDKTTTNITADKEENTNSESEASVDNKNEEAENKKDSGNKTNNTVLIIILSVLGSLIIGGGVALFFLIKKLRA